MRRTLALHLATSQLLNSSTPQLPDFLTLSFVFMYILALFPQESFRLSAFGHSTSQLLSFLTL